VGRGHRVGGADPRVATEGDQVSSDRLQALADATRQLPGFDTVEGVAALGCRLAVQLVPGARRAGVVRLSRDGHPTTVAAAPEPVGESGADAAGDDRVALPLECAVAELGILEFELGARDRSTGRLA